MTTRAPSPGELERSFARASQLQAELVRKERAIGLKVQVLARGLAGLMGPGAHLYRSDVGLHAFDVDGGVCLAAAYLEPEGDGYRYRYAVPAAGRPPNAPCVSPSSTRVIVMSLALGVASLWPPMPTTTTSSTGSPHSLPTSPAAWKDESSTRRGQRYRSGLPAEDSRLPSVRHPHRVRNDGGRGSGRRSVSWSAR